MSVTSKLITILNLFIFVFRMFIQDRPRNSIKNFAPFSSYSGYRLKIWSCSSILRKWKIFNLLFACGGPILSFIPYYPPSLGGLKSLSFPGVGSSFCKCNRQSNLHIYNIILWIGKYGLGSGMKISIRFCRGWADLGTFTINKESSGALYKVSCHHNDWPITLSL